VSHEHNYSPSYPLSLLFLSLPPLLPVPYFLAAPHALPARRLPHVYETLMSVQFQFTISLFTVTNHSLFCNSPNHYSIFGGNKAIDTHMHKAYVYIPLSLTDCFVLPFSCPFLTEIRILKEQDLKQQQQYRLSVFLNTSITIFHVCHCGGLVWPPYFAFVEGPLVHVHTGYIG